MRVPLHEVAVLEGAGLALVRVHHEVLWFRRVLRDEGPLPTRRKTRPAQTAQVGSGHLVDHLVRGHGGQSFPGREISIVTGVVFEPGPVWIFEARGEHGPVRTDEGIGLGRRFRVAWIGESVLDDLVHGPPLERPDKAFVELSHGRHLAGAQALDFREKDLPIRRSLARADLEAILDLVQQLGGPTQAAWQTRANPQFASAHGLGVKHVVEGDRFAHVGACDTQGAAHPGFPLPGDVALAFLDEPQERQHGRARLLVPRDDLLGLGFQLCGHSVWPIYGTVEVRKSIIGPALPRSC